jgi:hypothetical protein
MIRFPQFNFFCKLCCNGNYQTDFCSPCETYIQIAQNPLPNFDFATAFLKKTEFVQYYLNALGFHILFDTLSFRPQRFQFVSTLL